MEKQKQRATYFTDSQWEIIKAAAKRKGARSTAQYVSEVLLKQANKDIK